MFRIFNRSEPAKPAPTQADPAPPTFLVDTLPPLPEVSEGNDESDWLLWERAVEEMDSLLQTLTGAAPDAATGC